MEDCEVELLWLEVFDEMVEGENVFLIIEIVCVVIDDVLVCLIVDIVKSCVMFGLQVLIKDIVDFLGVLIDVDKLDVIKVVFVGGEDGLVEEIVQICVNLSVIY